MEDAQRESLVMFMDAIAALCAPLQDEAKNSITERKNWCDTCATGERLSFVPTGTCNNSVIRPI